MQNLQNEIMSRLMAGEPMPNILESLREQIKNTPVPSPIVQQPAQCVHAGRIHLDKAIAELALVLRLNGYDAEADTLSSLDDTKRETLLDNLGTILGNIAQVMQVMGL